MKEKEEIYLKSGIKRSHLTLYSLVVGIGTRYFHKMALMRH